MLKCYFENLGYKRICFMVLGNIFLGLGIGIFKLARLRNDAYNGMILAKRIEKVPYFWWRIGTDATCAGIFCANNEPCAAIRACRMFAAYGDCPSSNVKVIRWQNKVVIIK